MASLTTRPRYRPGRVFLRVARLTHELTDAALALYGLDRADLEVPSVVVRAGRPLSPAQIADDLHITRAGLTKRRRRIEAAGLIERHPHGSDGRSVVLTVTDHGRAAVEPALRHLLARLRHDVG